MSTITSQTEDHNDHNLPSFVTSHYTTELDQTWEYYERDSRSDVTTSQQHQIHSTNQTSLTGGGSYTRPWEMESKDKGCLEPFSKLPSFQSQFHAYSDPLTEPSLPQVTPVPVPVSPSSASPGNGSLTQLTPINTIQTGLTTLTTPSFHTLTAVNTRSYPLVPAPIQARDIPTINSQYLEERHIQLYQPISTFSPHQNTVVTVIKNEPSPNYDIKNGVHQSNYQNPITETDFEKAIKDNDSPMRTETRKKERRKIRASSLESSAESESSAMDIGDGNSGQVAAISSTANFKSPLNSLGMGECNDETGEKQVSTIFFI